MTSGHPYPEAFVVNDSKVSKYLLSFDNKDGAAKAEFLMRFGFSLQNPLLVMDALGRHPSIDRHTATVEAPHGVKFYFEGPLQSPDGRNPFVRTVWQVDYDSAERHARFITLKPRVPRASWPGMP